MAPNRARQLAIGVTLVDAPQHLPADAFPQKSGMEALPNRYAMTGEIQGDVLHIAAEIRGLAELVATA